MTEYSKATKLKNTLKNTLERLNSAKGGVGYQIEYKTTSSINFTKWKKVIVQEKEKEDRLIPIHEEFDEDLSKLMDDDSIAEANVTIYNGRSEIVGSENIVLRKMYEDDKYPVSRMPVNNEPKIEKEEPRQPKQQNMFSGNQVAGVLNLMGFGDMLNGTEDDSSFGGLGTILNVRDNMIRKSFEDKAREERLESLIVEKTKLEGELETAKKALEKAQKENEKLKKTIEEQDDELEELDKLRDKKEMFGAVGALALNRFVSAKADKIGGLFGIDGNTIRSVLNDEPQEAKEEEKSAPANEREQKTQNITTYLNTLDDDQFSEIYTLMGIFAQQESAVAACKRYLLGSAESEDEENVDVVEE